MELRKQIVFYFFKMNEWGDKDPEMEGWHHRGHMPGPHRGRMHGMFSFTYYVCK